MAKYSAQDRRDLADKGHALPDGSFPIADVEDLKSAIRNWALGKQPFVAKQFIVKRARALGAIDVVPDKWMVQKNLVHEETAKEYLEHFGVKGMKWGQRKAETTSAPTFNSRVTDQTRQLKSGGSLTMAKRPTPKLAQFIGKFIPAARKNIENGAHFSLRDREGNEVGDMSLFKESPTSMNVIWVGVNTSERGKGYASAAMDGAIGYARRQKLKTVTLEVPGNSPDARHIYEKKGFKVVHEEVDENDIAWGGLTTMRLDL